MTIGLNASMRTARLQLILDAIDADMDEYSTPSKLLIYSGERPSTGGSVDEYDPFLAEFALPHPCGSIINNVLHFSIIDDVAASVSGTATWGRIVDSNDDFIMDLSVSNFTGSGDIKLDSVNIIQGENIHCNSAIITEGNA